MNLHPVPVIQQYLPLFVNGSILQAICDLAVRGHLILDDFDLP